MHRSDSIFIENNPIKIYIIVLKVGGDHFRFGSVFIKKNNQTEIIYKKKPKLVQTDRFRFGSFFRRKTGLTRLFFPVFFRFGFSLVFSVSGL